MAPVGSCSIRPPFGTLEKPGFLPEYPRLRPEEGTIGSAKNKIVRQGIPSIAGSLLWLLFQLEHLKDVSMGYQKDILFEILRTVDLGNSVAENDDILEAARVETSVFSDLLEDRVDLIPGTKGSGEQSLPNYYGFHA